MPDIHIERQHTLGLAAARGIARQWVQKAEQDYGVACSYDEGERCDLARFSRAGIDGTCEVTADTITLRATLGFLYSSFSEQIEQRLTQNLDALMGTGTDDASVDDDAYNDKDWK
ncbi:MULTISPECIES: polyhydroxyalkanoic acid system family protein [unclassified Variovorax]|uniref:polyhydroxyalkanoic acid system family protein n=1 Tax=unclassified Variovorax TaxID=663243 RepID=UPI001319A09C|nr:MULTISPECIES: polyhydroxyalkanoic acid system family protein [unclassified Variovorax]VTU18838.1 putative polyhydroxyalkanoic acid system protein [Variovorax sp. PBL-E5]